MRCTWIIETWRIVLYYFERIHFLLKLQTHASYKTIHKIQRRRDVRIKYRGSWPQLSNIVSFVAAKPPAHRYRIIVPFVFQVSVKFLSASQPRAQPSRGYEACEIKGRKITRLQLYLAPLYSFPSVPFMDFPQFSSPQLRRFLPCLRTTVRESIHPENLISSG